MTIDPGTALTFEQMKAASRRLYVEVFGAGSLDAADEIMAVSCISHGPGIPPVVGTDPIKQQAKLLRGAVPDLKLELEDQLVEGDRVASRWSASGTNTGALRTPVGSVPPTDRRVAFTEIRIDRFEHGRIVESWFLPDRLTLWQQLGIVPAPRAAE
jgi:predicted ester cyclase